MKRLNLSRYPLSIGAAAALLAACAGAQPLASIPGATQKNRVIASRPSTEYFG